MSIPTMCYVGGVGKKLFYWAEKFVERFRRLNPELPVTIVTEEMIEQFHLKNPRGCKAFLWDLPQSEGAERVIWFDADMIPVKPLGILPGDPANTSPHAAGALFAAVQSAPGVFPLLEEKFPLMANVRDYFNSGFFVARREARCVFELVKAFFQHVSRSTGSFYDQSWFNLAVICCLGSYHILGVEYNDSVSAYGETFLDQVTTAHLPGWPPRDLDRAMERYWEMLT